MNLLRSEWIKLRSVSSHWVLWLVGIAFPLVITTLVTLLVDTDSFLNTDDLIDLISGSMFVSALLFAVVGTLSISGEFAHQTIRPTLAATPGRARVFGTKAALVGAVSGMLGLAVWLLNFAVGATILSARDGDVGFGDDGVAVVIVGTPLYVAGLALLGFGLGALIRSSPGAIVTLVLCPLLVEGLIALVVRVAGVNDAERYLPFTAGARLMASVSSLDGAPLGRAGSGVLFLVVVVAIAVAGAAANTRRDV